MMVKNLRTGLVMLAVLTLVTGIAYPLTVTAVSQVVFPSQANGSLVTRDGQVIGSVLIGQNNTEERYFWGRPSAVSYMAGSSPESLGSSGATNYGSTNATLAEQVAQRAADFRAAHGLAQDAVVPVEMLFASGSGLDPHISPEAARLQIERVAVARDLTPDVVANLVEQHIETPQLGVFGQPRVNVLMLNLALDALG